MTFYYPSKVMIDGKPRAISNISDLPNTNIVLQGTVGQGKSIFLRYLCIRELAQGSRIPIFLELRRLERGLTFRRYIYAGLRNLGFEIDDGLFDFYANSGKFVLLLDGFDELDKELVSAVITELENLSQQYPQLQVVITSRPDSGIERSAHFRVYRLAPLTESDHRPFLEKIVPEAPKVQDITKAIRQNSARIGSLLTTPLMMTLLVIIYKAEQTVPNELSEFYDNLFVTLMTRHDKSKPGFVRKRNCQLSERQMQELFEAFCFVTRQKELSILTEQQMHDCIGIGAKHSGIICESGTFVQDLTKIACLMQEEGFKYHFIHKSVQEYHAAAFVRHSPADLAIKFYARLQDNSKWSSWRQELTFLSQIDRYRYCKYFRLQHILVALKEFNVSNGKVAVKEEHIDRILRGSILNLQKDEKGFHIESGTLGHYHEYLLSEIELNCFHHFWHEIATDKNFQLADESILTEQKVGSEIRYIVKIPTFFRAIGVVGALERGIQSALGKLVEERDSIERYIAREEGKQELLNLA